MQEYNECMIEISSGSYEMLKSLLLGCKNICVVSDVNTYEAAYKRVEAVLQNADVNVTSVVLNRLFVLADERSAGEIFINCIFKTDDGKTHYPDFFLAVGSGTIVDITKLVSSKLNVPFGVCLTSTSFDACFSDKAHIVLNGTKESVLSQKTKFVLADVDVIMKAPYNMLLSGVARVLCAYAIAFERELSGIFLSNTQSLVKNADECFKIAKRLIKPKEINVKLLLESSAEISKSCEGNFSVLSDIAFCWERNHINEGCNPLQHGLYVLEAAVLVGFMCKVLHEYSEDEMEKKIAEKYIPYFDAVEKLFAELKIPFVIGDYYKIAESINFAQTKTGVNGILDYLAEKEKLDFVTERAGVLLCKFIEQNGLEAKL